MISDSSSLPASFAASSANEQLPLLCFSHLRWHFVTQRPQHLLRRAAFDRRVFYWEEPIWHDAGEECFRTAAGGYLELLPEGKSLIVVRAHLPHGVEPEQAQSTLLQGLLRKFDVREYACWYYTSMALGFTRDLKPKMTVYDCMDELSGFLNAPRELQDREQELFAKADVVFTGGISLYEAKRKQHANVHAFPSAIDATHFAQAKGSEARDLEPGDQQNIPSPRIGFYGVVDERLDIALLGAVAKLRPEMHFVLLGPVVKIDPGTLPRAANVHFLGSKQYEELPAYLAGWDAAILPFARNAATEFISPTKTPEYLAAGKPVVSTAIRDVVRDYGDAGLVAIADTAAEFAEALDKVLLAPDPKWAQAVEEKLKTISWDKTWAGMSKEMARVLTTKSSTARSARASLAPITQDVISNLRSNSFKHLERYDYIVAGAGFAGATLAERLASQLGKRVLVVDKRDHIAGNAYDFHNSDGVLVHKYGPHIFHTNSEKVFNYLSRFTAWRQYEHKVLASVDGKLLPMPINLKTINGLYNLKLNPQAMQNFLAERAEPLAEVRTSEDVVVSKVGRELFEKFFRNYTKKQWGLEPSELDASVAGRLPVRFNEDDRYFSDLYQSMPLHGYTRMFETMLDHPLISVRTGVEFEDARRTYSNAKIVFTGPIDEFYDFRFGALPYRSLEFRHETHDCEVFQSAPVVNYPNEHAYTRVTEFKYLTGQQHSKTSIVYEYPKSSGDPYYPIPRAENAALYTKYKALAESDNRVHFCGRLANYKYFNMDQVVAQALSTFERIANSENSPIPSVGRLVASTGVIATK